MANVIIKSEGRRLREARILRDFGHNPRTAKNEKKEQAEYIAEKIREAIIKMEGK